MMKRLAIKSLGFTVKAIDMQLFFKMPTTRGAVAAGERQLEFEAGRSGKPIDAYLQPDYGSTLLGQPCYGVDQPVTL
jgi:hypothetical protein